MKGCWHFFKKWAFVFFCSQLIYIIILRWVMPPITITQAVDFFSYGLKRDYVTWNNISDNVKLAVLASEDQGFLNHYGIDWTSLEKSMLPNTKRKSKKMSWGGGASTISQQTAKNVFLWQGSGVLKYIRKMAEFIYTPLMELFWSKKRILEVYLNVIEMGKGVFGIEAAAQLYFKKSARNLSREEAAKIVACFPNPKKFSVVKPTSRRVAWRYPQILNQMRRIEDDPKLQSFLK
ncbi:MAG: monofunctional biosynthetic peptidoglycan transglycosylase [Alphaproteobacteria bacterium]|nr:monofunctional biosynthetic peptidoglycan transglycosylase [Alphaproteobacteria bacterium]